MLGTCSATGDIDMASAPSFRADLRSVIDASDAALVTVDCLGVTFMGSAGYRVLLDATDYAVRRGHTLVVRNMSPACATLMRVCNADGALHLEA
jgi:anti-anti-sigma factor